MEQRDYKETNSFTTPAGYFDRLNESIIKATCKKPGNSNKSIVQHVAWRKFVGYAATVAVIATFIGSVLFNDGVLGTEKGTTVAETTVSNGEIDNEFIDNMLTNYPIDEYTFYCYLTE